jgi:hypothetical protein
VNLALRYYFILRLLEGEGFKAGKDTLVEIGSGPSGIGEFCEGRFIACDLKFPGAISKNLLPVRCDVVCLPFKDNCFDFVLSSDMIEHLDKHIREKAICEMIRIARKNIILAFPDGIKAQECDWKLYNHFRKNRKLVPPWLEEHIRQGHTFPMEDEIGKILKKKGPNFEVFKQENLTLHAWMVKIETLPVINNLKWLMRRYSLNHIWKVLSPFINFGKGYRKIFLVRKQRY